MIAPDLRGFGRSVAPEGVEAYGLPIVLSDVVALLDALGVERANVVGHDWGAAAGWGLAALRPDRVERLVALSVGHPATFPRAVVVHAALRLARGRGHPLPRVDRRGGGPERYIEDLSRPGRLTAALNWYRASVSAESFAAGVGSSLPTIQCPTLGVWSTDDLALGEQQMTDSAQSVNGPWRYERIEGAGHWIPLDASGRLNELLLDFLGSAPTSAPPA